LFLPFSISFFHSLFLTYFLSFSFFLPSFLSFFYSFFLRLFYLLYFKVNTKHSDFPSNKIMSFKILLHCRESFSLFSIYILGTIFLFMLHII
jgi:hypothetical protein